MQKQKNFWEDFLNFITPYKIYIFIGIVIVVSLILTSVSKENPTSYDGMVKKAEEYMNKGQIAFALEEYNKIVRLYPGKFKIHYKLAKIYNELNEPDRAKAEYIKGIRTGHGKRHLATLGLANIYCEEQRYDIAEDLVKDLVDSRNHVLLEGAAEIYYKSGKYYKFRNRLEAIRKFKKARTLFQKARSKRSKEALNQIFMTYAEISDVLTENKEYKKAIDILELSIDYEDNAIGRYKLAKIYEKNLEIEKAIKEYSNAFKIDPEVGNINSYAALLMKEAEIMELNGEKVKAELYRLKAKKINAKLDVPDNPDKRILFSLVAIKVNEDIERDALIPGIIFNLTNITDEAIKDLKAKVVFYEGNKPFSTQIMNVANEDYPLEGDARTSDISIYSDKPVKHVFDEHDLWAKVYFYINDSKDWKLFRNIPIIKEKEQITVKAQ